MCGSNGSNNACCPSTKIIQEKICGNFNNLNNPPNTALNITVWTAPVGDYIQGTFEIFSSVTSQTGVLVAGVITAPPAPPSMIFPTPGSSVATAVIRPIQFTLTVPGQTSGTYCITLYKRVLA
jgi:hypothetical protein